MGTGGDGGDATSENAAGGGGGGGSSFLIAGAIDPFFATDQTGDGEVRFTFDTAAGTCAAESIAVQQDEIGFVG